MKKEEARKQAIEKLHKWSWSKIKRLAPACSNNGWLNVHIAVLIGEAFNEGYKNAANEFNQTKQP